jgi:hypothetical protein
MATPKDYERKLREWRREHPKTDFALSFVPYVGTALAAQDFVEKPTALGAAGLAFAPVSRMVKALRAKKAMQILSDSDGKPIKLYRGLSHPTEEGMEGLPRRGYQTTLTDNPHVAGSWSGADEGAVISPFHLADDAKLVEFKGRYGDSMDYFGFDEAVQRLKDNEVLVARKKYDIGPRVDLEMDPDKLYSYASDIYATRTGKPLINALRGKK